MMCAISFMLKLVSVLFTILLVSGQERPTISTSLGVVRGTYKKSYEGRVFSSFEGIPYAKPPVGELRFKEPEAAGNWSGIWEATTPHQCLQLNPITMKTSGEEDCLYLNVYVPAEAPKPRQNLLDVVVNVHGGAFMLGSPALNGPEFLMDRDLVYVTFNYRLGLFGFLSTEDDVVPGNNGLKDQVMVLKWIQRSIRSFGGDPNSVTLIGLSAGGAAVHLHTLSPLSKGLYHRAISQSGTALVPWALQEAALEKSRKLAASVGCTSSSTKQLVACMKERSAEQLVENTSIFYRYMGLPISPFAPVVELASSSSFLTDQPYNLLQRGHVNDVPWITSVTTEEGVYPAFILSTKLGYVEENWHELLPSFLEYEYTVTERDKPEVARIIKEFYFQNLKPNDEESYMKALIKMFGERYFIVDFEKAARLHAKAIKSPVYAYMYNHRGERCFPNEFGSSKFYGVSHGDDGFLLYNVSFFGVSKTDKLNADDSVIKNILVDMVATFSQSGKPEIKNVSWKPVTDIDFQYLFIKGPDEIQMNYKDEIASVEFWRSLNLKENENLVLIKDEL